MKLGRNLIIQDGVIHVIFRSDETKNHAAIQCVVPGFLKPYLVKYLDDVRPLLLSGNTSDAVWISQRHQAIGYGACPYLFYSIGMRLLGYPITCHTFRYSAATAILTKDPRKIKIASGVLGHDGLRTVNQFYDQSGEVGSRRVWDKMRRDILRGKGL
jgi:integrase